MANKWRAMNARLMNFDRVDGESVAEFYAEIGTWVDEKSRLHGGLLSVLAIQGDANQTVVVYIIEKE